MSGGFDVRILYIWALIHVDSFTGRHVTIALCAVLFQGAEAINLITKRGVLRKEQEIEIGPPLTLDGTAVNRLVASCPPLDTNSVYCNLLQCTHFDDTSICAKCNGELVGFVSGYIIPKQCNTLFIWQVAVADSARGQGLAIRMLNELLELPSCREVDLVETTITPSNEASQALFRKFADQHATTATIIPGFEQNTHFDGQHESEQLWRIGPITKTQPRLLI